MLRMVDDTPTVRLTESLSGRVAGFLLVVLWIFSMSGVDSNAFSAFPACVVLVVAQLLVLGAMVSGKRLVRMSATGWFSLAVGGYFLLRCLNSYAVVDSWAESALILAGVVYYVAGVYVAQNKNYTGVFAGLAVALLLSLLAWWAVRQPWFCLEWTGRASFTPAGNNSRPMALLIYKNFAGVFFCVGGSALFAWALWTWRGVSRWGGALLGVASILAAFLCGTRAVYLVLPLVVVLCWLFRVIVRLFRDERIGGINVLVGVGLLVACLVAVAEFLFGGRLAELVDGADTHLRYYIWAAVCEVLPSTPLWGYGANATTWELIPYYSEWQLPNYAHNEYLQVWVDYGFAGVLLVLVVVVVHLLRGLRCLATETLSAERRHLAALCMLVLVSLAAYAFVDFPWHSFALVSMSAFACGVLASPFAYRHQSWLTGRTWAGGSQAPLVPVRAQKTAGRVVLASLLLALLGYTGWLGYTLQPAWCAQWEYNELSAPGRDADSSARRMAIARLLPQYPSPALMDTFYMFPQNYTADAEKERLLKLALAGNPKQLFTAVMLADVLGAQNKFAEAEQLFRTSYASCDMPASLLNNWPGYYAYHLLRRGRFEMQQGNHALALSMLEHSLAIRKKKSMSFDPIWRQGNQPWKEHGGVKPGIRQLLKAAEADLHMLRLIGTQPDDSWMQPLAPGGKPALYRSFVKKPRL